MSGLNLEECIENAFIVGDLLASDICATGSQPDTHTPDYPNLAKCWEDIGFNFRALFVVPIVQGLEEGQILFAKEFGEQTPHGAPWDMEIIPAVLGAIDESIEDAEFACSHGIDKTDCRIATYHVMRLMLQDGIELHGK